MLRVILLLYILLFPGQASATASAEEVFDKRTSGNLYVGDIANGLLTLSKRDSLWFDGDYYHFGAPDGAGESLTTKEVYCTIPYRAGAYAVNRYLVPNIFWGREVFEFYCLESTEYGRLKTKQRSVAQTAEFLTGSLWVIGLLVLGFGLLFSFMLKNWLVIPLVNLPIPIVGFVALSLGLPTTWISGALFTTVVVLSVLVLIKGNTLAFVATMALYLAGVYLLTSIMLFSTNQAPHAAMVATWLWFPFLVSACQFGIFHLWRSINAKFAGIEAEA